MMKYYRSQKMVVVVAKNSVLFLVEKVLKVTKDLLVERRKNRRWKLKRFLFLSCSIFEKKLESNS